MRKKSFKLTLTEVIIAFALSALLLGTVMGTLTRMVKTQNNLFNAKEILGKRLTMQRRLTHIFSHSSAHSVKDSTLIFTVDNGYDHDAKFRGIVSAKIFKKNGHLLLELNDGREELLCDCKTVEWEFFPKKEKLWVVMIIDGKTKYPFRISTNPRGLQL